MPLRTWAPGPEDFRQHGAVPAPSLPVVAAAVALLSVLGPTWRLTRTWVSALHELGHAVAGLLVGARIEVIALRPDTSGHTRWAFPGEPGRLRVAWVAWWGYPVPSLVGAAGAWSYGTGHTRPYVVFLAVTVAVVLVAWVRNPWGVLVCAAATAALAVAARHGGAVAEATAVVVAVVSVAGGARATLEHLRSRTRDPGSDSNVVGRQLVVLPATVVRLAYVVLAVAAAAWSVGVAVDQA